MNKKQGKRFSKQEVWKPRWVFPCLLSLALGLMIGFPLSLVSCLLPPAFSEESGTVLKVGVLDVRQVFAEYERTSAQEGRFKELAGAKQLERERIVSNLKDLRDEMMLLNETGRLERRDEFEGKLKGLADFDRSTKDSLTQERGEAIRGILDEIELMVAQYSRDRGFDLILTDRAAIFSSDTIDVTEDIILLLNRRYAQN